MERTNWLFAKKHGIKCSTFFFHSPATRSFKFSGKSRAVDHFALSGLIATFPSVSEVSFSLFLSNYIQVEFCFLRTYAYIKLFKPILWRFDRCPNRRVVRANTGLAVISPRVIWLILSLVLFWCPNFTASHTHTHFSILLVSKARLLFHFGFLFIQQEQQQLAVQLVVLCAFFRIILWDSFLAFSRVVHRIFKLKLTVCLRLFNICLLGYYVNQHSQPLSITYIRVHDTQFGELKKYFPTVRYRIPEFLPTRPRSFFKSWRKISQAPPGPSKQASNQVKNPFSLYV